MNSSEEQAPLSNLKGMTPELLRVLNHHKIDSQEALAELSIDDLLVHSTWDVRHLFSLSSELIPNSPTETKWLANRQTTRR